jgi:hypothetical protein
MPSLNLTGHLYHYRRTLLDIPISDDEPESQAGGAGGLAWASETPENPLKVVRKSHDRY